MSRFEITEHAGYLGDTVKIDAYRRAMSELVEPGMSVLDLGAGTGLLGLLAAEAGARVVYAVDRGGILAAAEAIAAANGYGDRFVGIRGFSKDVVLPEPVDLAVCDQIGGLAYDAGVLEYFQDVQERLLAPGGRLLPASFKLFTAPVTTEFWPQSVGLWNTRPGGFDFAPMGEYAANTEFRLELDKEAFLAEPAEFASVSSACNTPIRGEVELDVHSAGVMHGLAGMFVAQLSPTVTLTNCPLWPSSFRRWQTFYPLDEPVNVSAGDTVVAEFDVRPLTYVATWTVTVRPAEPGRAAIRHRGSTVLGTLVGPDDLAADRPDSIPHPTLAVAADRYVLDLVDGTRCVGDIITLVRDRYGDVFTNEEDAKRRVTGLLARHLRKQSTCGT